MSSKPPPVYRNRYTHLPVIRRTRSWRGIMQVRFDDSRADSMRLGTQALFWAPLRVFGLGLLATTVVYFALGHDAFLQALLGYESEMQYEARVNPVVEGMFGPALDKNKGWKSPVRDLERPLTETPKFDVFRDPKST